MKPGIAVNQKTKLSGKKILISLTIISQMIFILSCSQSYLSSTELTATAMPPQPPGQTQLSIIETLIESSPTPHGSPLSQVIGEEPTQPTITKTAQPSTQTSVVESPQNSTQPPPILYYTQAGDTLPILAIRFEVQPDEIKSTEVLSTTSFLDPGKLLIIPNRLGETSQEIQIIPDSEVVFSPSAIDFDIQTFAAESGGYLSNYREYMSTGWANGAQVVNRVAIENSINPRLLLSLLEHHSHWVYGQPQGMGETDYPMGYLDPNHKGLFRQLSWTVQQLSIGYYGWRAGLITSLELENGKTIKLSPKLNAGSVAIMYYYSKLYSETRWNNYLYTTDGLPVLHERMFGNPWLRALSVEPLFPQSLTQPKFELPFRPGRTWSLTGGPHSAWGPNGALAALDFAPSTSEQGCSLATDWVTSVAPGLVVRSGSAIVVVDLDGDGQESTGWAILYMHIATRDRIPKGSWVNTDDFIGYPSCEGGTATGTHVHIARKYNGEWMLADGPIPFTLDGWIAHAGEQPYLGSLTNGEKTAIACTCGDQNSLVSRSKSKP